jgi:hypothetical protein
VPIARHQHKTLGLAARGRQDVSCGGAGQGRGPACPTGAPGCFTRHQNIGRGNDRPGVWAARTRPSRFARTNPILPGARAPGHSPKAGLLAEDDRGRRTTSARKAAPSRPRVSRGQWHGPGHKRPSQRRVRGGFSPPSRRHPCQPARATGFAAARGRGERSRGMANHQGPMTNGGARVNDAIGCDGTCSIANYGPTGRGAPTSFSRGLKNHVSQSGRDRQGSNETTAPKSAPAFQSPARVAHPYPAS